MELNILFICFLLLKHWILLISFGINKVYLPSQRFDFNSTENLDFDLKIVACEQHPSNLKEVELFGHEEKGVTFSG